MSVRLLSRVFLAPLAAACALSAAACSDGTEGGGDGGTARSCKSVLDCPSGQACQQEVCVVLPCGGRCTEEEVCVQGSCRPGDGLDCENDPGLCPAGFRCSINDQCQRECTVDDDCTAAGFRSCNPEAGICGQCTFASDCTDSQKPVCDPQRARCVGCVDNGDCRQDGAPVGRYCDKQAQACRDGCNGDADCRAGQRCEGGTQTTVGRCVECKPATEANDCAAFFPRQRCDPQTLQCVECLLNADCTSTQCDTTNKRCVECVENQACAKGYMCDQDAFACFPGCAGGRGGPNCPDVNPRLPVCDPNRGERGTCVECLRDADCPRAMVCLQGTAENAPRCVVGCRQGLSGPPDDSRCAPSNPTAPELETKCDGSKGDYGRCVQCLDSSQCGSDKVCDVERGVCRCKKEGETCASSAECGYQFVNNATNCNAPRPYCITAVRCNGSPKSVPPVCSRAGFGLPEQGDTTGCPQGFLNERACDASGTCAIQCVPNTNTYKCSF